MDGAYTTVDAGVLAGFAVALVASCTRAFRFVPGVWLLLAALSAFELPPVPRAHAFLQTRGLKTEGHRAANDARFVYPGTWAGRTMPCDRQGRTVWRS